MEAADEMKADTMTTGDRHACGRRPDLTDAQAGGTSLLNHRCSWCSDAGDKYRDLRSEIDIRVEIRVTSLCRCMQ
jgi:hypothetical protein